MRALWILMQQQSVWECVVCCKYICQPRLAEELHARELFRCEFVKYCIKCMILLLVCFSCALCFFHYNCITVPVVCVSPRFARKTGYGTCKNLRHTYLPWTWLLSLLLLTWYTFPWTWYTNQPGMCVIIIIILLLLFCPRMEQYKNSNIRVKYHYKTCTMRKKSRLHAPYLVSALLTGLFSKKVEDYWLRAKNAFKSQLLFCLVPLQFCCLLLLQLFLPFLSNILAR